MLRLTAAVVWKVWGPAHLHAIAPLLYTSAQVRSGLMVAVLSFIGFESAANLGREALQPERAIARGIPPPCCCSSECLGLSALMPAQMAARGARSVEAGGDVWF
jgi:hypothetical protein